MVIQLAAGVVAAALAAGESPARPTELARFPATQTVQTLAIGGANVFAATRLPDGSVRLLALRRGSRRTIGGFGTPIPAEGRPGFELGRVTQSLRLSASGTRLAVLRTVRAVWSPDCARRGCRRPDFTEPLLSELYVARPGQRLRRLVRVEHRVDGCALTPTHVVVSGSMIAYVSKFGEGSACRRGGSVIAVASFRDDSVVHHRVFTAARDEISALALAGSYVVWATRRPPPCPCSTVVVADWRRGTTRFRFVARRLLGVGDLAVTAQAAVALVGHVQRLGCARSEIVLLRSRARPRVVGTRATSIGGFVGTRLVHAGYGDWSCAGARQRISVTNANGRTRVLRRISAVPSGLDFDGTYVVYSVPLRARSSSPQVVYRQQVR